VLLEDIRNGRLEVRSVDSEHEFARVRRIHPNVDEDLLRSLKSEFTERLRAPAAEAAAYLEKLNQSLSNALQLSPQRGLLADDFDTELDRLYRVYVSPPSKRAGGIVQSVREFMREKLMDVFRRHRLLGKLESRVRVEGFTHPGDSMRMDFGYQNGVRGFIHAVSLKRDTAQAKVLAYTASRIHARDSAVEVTAITEMEPQADNRQHRFVSEVLGEQHIQIVPMNHVERFAEDLRLRLN
jgi:hypothetical protein